MNIKQKMIEAMDGSLIYTTDKNDGKCGWEIALDAALAVLADPENWTDEMESAFSDGFMAIDKDETGDPPSFGDGFTAVINHVREQKG